MTEEWTFTTLKLHLESQIAALDRRHSELAQERNRALEAGLATANEKAKSHNDVLGAMKDQQAAFVTKDQAALQFKGLATAIAAIAAVMGIFVYLSGVAT